MRLSGHQVGHDFGNALHGLDDELNAELVGERFDEIVFGTRDAIGAHDVRRGAVAGDHTQLAGLENLVEEWRR